MIEGFGFRLGHQSAITKSARGSSCAKFLEANTREDKGDHGLARARRAELDHTHPRSDVGVRTLWNEAKTLLQQLMLRGGRHRFMCWTLAFRRLVVLASPFLANLYSSGPRLSSAEGVHERLR
jgi:hypothetical protein